MSKLSWLHLTDLHCGMGEQKHLWPNIQDQFFEDIQKLHEKSGPWDVVFFTGDLVQRGAYEEFESLSRLLERLWGHFKDLGSYPLLITIPGNHDLGRPSPKSAAVRLLTKWSENPDVHAEFWEDKDSDYRKVIETAFKNYSNWLESFSLTTSVKMQRGILPGDISVTLEKKDLRVGIIGLNTAFLQLTGGDYNGRLAINSRQFHEVCGGDGAQWAKQHNACLLLTHHPTSWLNEESQNQEYAEIAPAGRFVIHLFGHMHEHMIRGESIGGGPVRRAWQGSSLFGLEYFGEDNKRMRSHGYSAGQIEVNDTVGSVRIWPRTAKLHKVNGWRLIPDNENFILESDEATPPERFEARVTESSNRKVGLQVNDISLLQAKTSRASKKREFTDSLNKHVKTQWPWPYDDPLLKDYCDALIKSHGYIRFVEVPYLKDTSDVEIESLYVIPQFSQQEIHADIPPRSWPKGINAISALQGTQRIILLGDPGSGKSTLVNCLTWQLSRPKVARANAWTKAFGGMVPLPMVLRELKLKADLTWEGLLDAFLAHRIGKLLRSRKHIEALLDSGRAVVLLDGLDEIGNINIRRKLREAAQTGMAAYPQVRWILTSRIVGYDQVPFHLVPDETRETASIDTEISSKGRRSTNQIASVLYLSPFSDEQIKEFAHNWYNQHEKEASVVDESAKDLIEAIHDNEGTQRLARIPYLLTLMALIHHKNARLPHGRTELYDRIAAAYLESIDMRRELDELPYSLAQKKRWLAEIAYQMQVRRTKTKNHQAGRGEILASKRDVQKWLVKAMIESGAENAKQEANSLLDYFARRSGLLLPRGEGQFAFMHLSLQEYFAACYLEPRLTASRFSPIRKKLEPTDAELRSWANNIVWRETFVLLFELLASKDVSESEGLISHLFDKRFDNAHLRGSEKVAIQLLSELTVDSYVSLTAATRKRMRKECWRWIFNERVDRSIRSVLMRSRDTSTIIARTLLFEHKGDISKAWQAAGLSKNELKEEVQHLNFSGCTNVSDLTPLAGLKNLRELYLNACVNLTDLTPLSRLKGLERLSLEGCTGVSDLSPLADLNRLQELNLGRCRSVRDIKPISNLTNLKALVLNRPTSKDYLHPLINLGALRTLIIDESPRTLDLTPLAGLDSLSELHLHAVNANTDLEPLCALSNLRDLCIARSSSGLVVPKELRLKMRDLKPMKFPL